jgi:hypothetical protein
MQTKGAFGGYGLSHLRRVENQYYTQHTLTMYARNILNTYEQERPEYRLSSIVCSWVLFLFCKHNTTLIYSLPLQFG